METHEPKGVPADFRRRSGVESCATQRSGRPFLPVLRSPLLTTDWKRLAPVLACERRQETSPTRADYRRGQRS